MASNLRVDSIVPATGSNVSIGTATGGVTIPGDLGIAGTLTYEDVANIDSVGVITARSGINVTSGRVLIGTTTAGDATADDLTIETSGSTGITLRSDSGYAGNIQFADGTSGDDQLRGVVQYHHSDNSMRFMTNASERIRIGSVGQLGIGGANYGTSGQVLTSQGNSSAVQWANAGGITHARGYRLNNTPDASGGTIDLTNWAYENSAFNGHLGSGWSLPSSGVFTFPTTGIYDVSMMGMMRQASDSNAWCGVQGKATTNNSSYSIAFECYQQIVQASGSTNQYVNFYGHCILDVTDTSNVKFKVSFFADQNEQVYLHGGGSYNQTALKFTRLGDT